MVRDASAICSSALSEIAIELQFDEQFVYVRMYIENRYHRVCESKSADTSTQRNPAARNGKHAGPPLPPREERRETECHRCFSCSRCSQAFNKRDCLGTPPASGLNHDKLTPVALQQLCVIPLLVASGFGEHGPIHSGSVRARSSASGHHTPHCDVHGQLGAVVHRRP